MKKILFLLLIISINTIAQPPEPPAGFRWVLFDTYSDEFDGNILNPTKWKNTFNNWQGRPPAKFEPSAVSVKDGTMQLKSGKYASPQGNYTMYGGAVTSLDETASFGYYEVRFKASKIAMSTTFWLSNSKQSYNPTACTSDRYSQELDVVEAAGDTRDKFSGFRTKQKSNTHHRYVPCGATQEIFYSSGATSETLSSEVWQDFHTYGMQWHNENSATFYANGKEGETVNFNTTIDDKPFDRPMFMAMVSETYDWLTPYPTTTELNNDAINTAYYDWVRSYRLVPIFDAEPLENTLGNLKNGDFESGDLSYWSGWGGTIKTVSTVEPYQGTYAAHIKGAGAHDRVVILKPNTTYILKCFAKVLNGKMNLGAKENNDTERFLGATTITSTNYEEATLEFTTGTETDVKIYFYAQTTSDEAYGDNFVLIEKNPPAKTPIFTENISFNATPTLSNGNTSLTVSYNYKANLDREINFKIYDANNNIVHSNKIDGLEGFGNNSTTFSLNQTLTNSGYKVVADIRPKGGNDAQIISSVTSAQLTLSSESFVSQNLNIELYPNPADTFVFIKSDELQGTTKITIHNLLGQIVKKVEFQNNSFKLDISSLSNKGVYFLTFKNNGKSSVKKLIIK